jgi:hypothetical protein
MNILSLIRKPATTAEQLKAKLETLRASNPLAGIERLQNDRKAALLNCDYAGVEKIDADIRKLEFDEQARELAIERTHREIGEAEQAEHADAQAKAKKRAEALTAKMPAALAELGRAFETARAKLDVIHALNVEVDSINETLPEADRFVLPELVHRGWQPADKREERSRRVVEEFWARTDNGAELSKKQVEEIEYDANGNASIWVINLHPDWADLWTLPDVTPPNNYEHDTADYPKRRVRVERRRRVDVLFDEARGAHVFSLLQHEVHLPPVMVADSRRPRGTITLRHVERVEPVAADVETIEAAE